MGKKAIVFVDSNNWYHNVKRYYSPGDVDIIKIAKLICSNLKYDLKEIRVYASTPSIEDGEKMYYSHLSYLEHLKKGGVNVITRKLQKLSNKEILKKKKEIVDNLDLCKNCKPLVEASFLDLADIKRKEKGIDVWIAVDMLNLAVINDECNMCVLISGDADFVPAMDIIKNKGKGVLTAMTPLGYSRELIQKFPYFIIKPITLMQCFRNYQNRTTK